MPLEINEIGIHMRVRGSGDDLEHNARGSHQQDDPDPCCENCNDEDRLVQRCVQRVVEVLRRNGER